MKLQDITLMVRRHFKENQSDFGKRIGATQTKVSRMEKSGINDELEQTWQAYVRLIKLADAIGIDICGSGADAEEEVEIPDAVTGVFKDAIGSDARTTAKAQKSHAVPISSRRAASGGRKQKK